MSCLNTITILAERKYFIPLIQILNSLTLTTQYHLALVITGGVWELYSGVNYTGSNVTLGQGHYPTPLFLRPIVNDDLTSVRLIVFGRFRAF